MKRPSFQFYPADLRNNAKFRRCTWAAKGVWFELLCLLHDADEYGILRWDLKEISLALGCPVKLLQELADKRVLKGADSGTCEEYVFTPRHAGKDGKPVTLVKAQDGPVWYSSRMVLDEYKRLQRGAPTRFEAPPNPAPKVPPKGTSGDGSTSSSSSSSSFNPLNPPRGEQAGAHAAGGVPAADYTPDEVPPGSVRAAFDALSKWSEVSTRFPLAVGHNHEFHVRKLIAALEEQPPIIHGGQQVKQQLLIPLAVENLITSKTEFKSTAFACTCVKNKLDQWAKTGAPAPAAAPKSAADSSAVNAPRKMNAIYDSRDAVALIEADRARRQAQNPDRKPQEKN